MTARRKNTLKNQGHRLLRQNWDNPNDLAKEVYRAVVNQGMDEGIYNEKNLHPIVVQRVRSTSLSFSTVYTDILAADIQLVVEKSAVLIFLTNYDINAAPPGAQVISLAIDVNGVNLITTALTATPMPYFTSMQTICKLVEPGTYTIKWKVKTSAGTYTFNSGTFLALVFGAFNADIQS